MTYFSATTNPFGGILPKPDALPENPGIFQDQLNQALADWRREGYKVVWLEVPIKKAALIPVAVSAGFIFHHSSETYLMLIHRLEAGAFVPPYATHYIGAGGVVLNEQQALLVVSERYRRNKDVPSYKLPGGALHSKEHLAEAVVREVYEETGVRAKFERLICFRHWHGYRWGKSDIYFVCRLSALSEVINKEDEEIDEALWMPVEDYLSNDYVHSFNKSIVKAALNSPGLTLADIDGYVDPEMREIFMPANLA